MKKIILILSLLTMVSCNLIEKTPKEKLVEKSEEELKKIMHDPYSYEFISFEENFDKETEDQLEIKELGLEDFDMKVKFFTLKYRGKNKFGALIINETIIKASYDDLVFLSIVE